ncbi:MAG: apolipoprotein N-acyltransferase [Deltaproteobacteria bacterium]|nr:apolipoprotein N-acyltransferase [Deltaproteobacteria bacterium]
MTRSPLVLTFLSAAFYAASFPPFFLYPLAWMALVPFFLAVTTVPPFAAALYGILWSIFVTFGVAWWLPEMVANYLAVSVFIGWICFFAVGIGLAGIYFGAFAAWLSWLARRRLLSPLLVAVGWGVCEFARATFAGNPWALSGYSQTKLVSLMQIADLAGPYGIGMLIAAVNARLAGLVNPLFSGQRPTVSLVGMILAAGLVFAYGEWRLTQSFSVGQPLQVAIIQGAIAQPLRWKPEFRKANLEHYFALTKEAIMTSHPTLIFWPEYAIEFYLQEPSPYRDALLNMTKKFDVDIVAGGPHYRFVAGNTRYHNSVFVLQQGTVAGRYDKMRLVPLAEQRMSGWNFLPQRRTYEPGQTPTLLSASNAQLGVFICFEALQPDFIRTLTQQGAEILVNPTNDDWFGVVGAAQHHLDIATVRAIENRRYLVRPASSGFSAVIDPHGRLIVRSTFGTAAVLSESLFASRAQTLYQWWGDAPMWLTFGYILAVSLLQVN